MKMSSGCPYLEETADSCMVMEKNRTNGVLEVGWLLAAVAV
jgi:hypothetical protein